MAWNSKDVTTAGTSELVVASDVNYVGFSARESAGATAQIRVRMASVTGTILDRIQLEPNESAREAYVNPAFARNGIYVEYVSGSATFGVRYS